MSGTLRILSVTLLFIGTGLLGAWIYMRDSGLSRPISPVRHPFFDSRTNEGPYLIAYQGGSTTAPNSLDAIESATRLHPRLIIWVDVLMTGDGTLVAHHDISIPRNEANGKPTLVSFMKDAELGVGDRVAKLEDVLRIVPEHRLILNVREYRPTLDNKLVEIVEGARAGDRVLIQSESDGLLRDVRKLRATWLFGTSQAQITQLLMLIPFGLEAVAPFKGDVYITAFTRGGAKLVKPEVIVEVHRRNRKIFVGPVDDVASGEELLKRGVDGVITSTPEKFVKLLK